MASTPTFANERPAGPPARLKLAIKLVLLAVFVLMPDFGALERIAALGPQPALLVFCLVWLLAVAAIAHIALFSPPLYRLAWTCVLVPGMLVAYGFRKITQQPFGFLEADRLFGLAAFAEEAVAFYGQHLLDAAAYAVVGVAAINLPVRLRPPAWLARHARLAPALHLAPLLLMVAILYARGGQGTHGMPGHYTTASFAVTLLGEQLTRAEETGERAIGLPPATPRLRNVVVVMDESIRGDLLDLNDPTGGIVSGLQGRRDTVNFGVASSIANCSTASNAAFRHAVSSRDYLQDLRENPSLWKYARHAGFETVYLDGQRTGGRLQNRMDERELGHIDRHVQLPPGIPAHRRDRLLARHLRRILAEPGRHFIYVNKMGAHFPYEGKYPANRRTHAPTMVWQAFGSDEIDPDRWSGLAPGGADADFRRRMRNSYLNAATWNTRGFFETLLPGLDLSDTLLVYTADHGQDLHEDGRPGLATHCSLGPAPPAQGKVPLVVLSGDPQVLARLRAHARRNYGRASQFNLIPSVLAWMGYPADAIAASGRFDPALSATLDGSGQRFLSTFYVRLGREPHWNPIHR